MNVFKLISFVAIAIFSSASFADTSKQTEIGLCEIYKTLVKLPESTIEKLEANSEELDELSLLKLYYETGISSLSNLKTESKKSIPVDQYEWNFSNSRQMKFRVSNPKLIEDLVDVKNKTRYLLRREITYDFNIYQSLNEGVLFGLSVNDLDPAKTRETETPTSYSTGLHSFSKIQALCKNKKPTSFFDSLFK